MCLFTFDSDRNAGQKPVVVHGTYIFARGLPDGRQHLVYSMRYDADFDLAMVLPLPTPPDPAEHACKFIDLSACDWFFGFLSRGFPRLPPNRMPLSAAGSDTASGSKRAPLQVREVGSFEASFVPSRADFARLDPRFRLPPSVLDALPAYRDFSFAVFKLQQGKKEIHPLALSFPRRDHKALFFPTVHAHDGTVPPKAEFDHALYAQGVRARTPGWMTSYSWEARSWESLPPEEQEQEIFEHLAHDSAATREAAVGYLSQELYGRSCIPAKRIMGAGWAMSKTAGLVDPELPVAMIELRGLQVNTDTVVPGPA